MSLIPMATAILGLLAAVLTLVSTAIEFITRVRKGKSRENRKE